MAINYDKIKVILITTSKKLHSHFQVSDIFVKRVSENVKKEKLLGLVVEQNLSWNVYIDKVHKTVSMLLLNLVI